MIPSVGPFSGRPFLFLEEEMVTEATPATPATPATTTAATPPKPHESFLQHLAALLPHLHHLGGWLVKAAPIAIQAGVHASPQAELAITALTALHEIVEAHQSAPAAEPSAEPAAVAPATE
jgi:hypothetical protein